MSDRAGAGRGETGVPNGTPGTATHGKCGPQPAEAKYSGFLRAIFGTAVPNAYVTSFTEDPTGDYPLNVRGRMWGGGTYAERRGSLTDDTNQYVCVSTFNPSRDPADNGRPRRQRVLFARCYAIMVDDIGTKVREEALRLKPFTALVETSPGNFQGWYALDPRDPEAEDPGKVDYVVDQMISRGLAKVDPGMRGVTRYGRLPAGVNNKSKLGRVFNVRLAEINTKKVYKLREVAEAYEINLDDMNPPEPGVLHGARIRIPETEREKYATELIAALEKAGCEPHEHPNKPGGFDILCPWRDTHTNGDTTGSMLFIPGYIDPGTGVEYVLGGYKCHHGHCETRRLRDVLAFLNSAPHNARLTHPAWLSFPPMPPDRAIQESAGLLLNAETGVPKKIQHNLDVIILNDPQYVNSGGFQLAYDVFSNETFVSFESESAREHVVHLRSPGRAIPNQLSLAVQLDVFRTHRVEFSPAMIDRGLDGRMMNNKFDSAMEWAAVTARQWDGQPRIDRWLIEIAGAPDNPFVRAVSERILIAVAKRAMTPGFKFDHIMILEGSQGMGKSTMLRELAPRPEWYASTHFDVTNKDAVVDSIGKLIIEFEEIQALRRVDHNAMKGFLSRTTDRIRLPYERSAQDFPRRVVFFGTTNDKTYLSDETGNRRYWPISLRAGRVDFRKLAEIKDQLWAEAAARAAKIVSPSQLALSKDLSEVAEQEAQARHLANSDPWFSRVSSLVDEEFKRNDGRCVYVNSILEQLGVSQAAQTRNDSIRLASIFRALGLTSVKRRWKAGAPPTYGWVYAEME